jgi:hypothetical protein
VIAALLDELSAFGRRIAAANEEPLVLPQAS